MSGLYTLTDNSILCVFFLPIGMEFSWGRVLCFSSVMSVKGLNMMWSCKLCSVIEIHWQCKLKFEILSEM